MWILIPSLLWLGATLTRPMFITPRCSTTPELCTKDSVLPMDQFSMSMEDPLADEYSYRTQNFSGLWAFAVPAAWTTARFLTGGIVGGIALTLLNENLITLLQVISWNGLFTELSHLASQRPRPFVFSDPTYRGIDPAHYTSFYSGHTSFVAATTTAVFLILLNQDAPFLILCLTFASSEALILSTAYFRIFAGRHFLTDVICGAIAGSLIAYLWVNRSRRKNA